MTSSTAFQTGKVADQNTQVPAPTKLTLPGTTTQLINDNGSACGNGKVSLIYAFTVSCNTVFGDLGLHLSGSALRAQANKYNFNNPNQTLAPGMQVAQSNFPLYTDPAQRAGGAIGQQSDTVTPLQEAMLSAAVANNGVLMKPYLVQKVTAPDLSAVSTTTPTPLGTAVTPTQAAHLQAMMTNVVQSPLGTAHRHRRDAGHRGDRDRREDRDGPERHQQLRAGRRGIHLLRADHQPADSRRRRSKGRRLRCRCGRPDRSGTSSRPTSTPRGRGEPRDHGRRRDAG